MQDKKFDIGISSRFRQIREKFNLTQQEFAQRLTIEQAAVSKIENNRKQLDTSVLRMLVEIFQININWIVTGDGPVHPKDINGNGPLDPDPRIASLMEGARRVLTSGNLLAFHALEQNIMYFDHAIAAEKRADEMEKKIEEMEENFKIMMEELTRLKRENLRLDMEAEEQSLKKKVA